MQNQLSAFFIFFFSLNYEVYGVLMLSVGE